MRGNGTRSVAALVFLVCLCAGASGLRAQEELSVPGSARLYWFIPDGLRADPKIFNLFEWAEAGELPNIKRLMEKGVYGFSRPTFPGHTPTNFASLLTGTYPERHGVADGPMHIEGKPLDRVAVGGFSSVAKKVAPIWSTLESKGRRVSLLSVPGSTPPELSTGNVFRGRWGGWGADFHALLFETRGTSERRIKQGRGSRLFFFGPELTRYLDPQPAQGWAEPAPSESPALEAVLDGWGAVYHIRILDSTEDAAVNYDTVQVSPDKKRIVAVLKEGQRSDWLPVTLQWKAQGEEVAVKTSCQVSVIKLEPDGFFRLRIFYNNLNEYNTQPGPSAAKLLAHTGPMVDFVDNFPPQLIYYPQDKQAFLDEMNASLDWHRRAVRPLLADFASDVVIHDTYSPNQMLTSRWWMGGVDPTSRRYDSFTEEERAELWREVKAMYAKIDAIVGEMLDAGDEKTVLVLSSDHGAVPLDRWVFLNNLFAKKGWLHFSIDPKTGEPSIDWEKTQVVYLKMAHVYVSPDGLSGPYRRASGEAYEALRDEVAEALRLLEDENGRHPAAEVVRWEDVGRQLRLPTDRVGDLVIANVPGYGWNEEMTADGRLFEEPLSSGYKQAILSGDVPGMWTPFIIAGPGIKHGRFLGAVPVEMVDQYPTILTALGLEVPETAQGKVLDVFE